MTDLEKPADSSENQAVDTHPRQPAARKKAAAGRKNTTGAKAVAGPKAATGPKPPAAKAPGRTTAKAPAKRPPAVKRPAASQAEAAEIPPAPLSEKAGPIIEILETPDPSPAIPHVPPAAPEAPETPEPPEAPRSPAPMDFEELSERMMALQQEIRALGIPVVILLEGWDAAGKGILLGELLEGLDPRGYKVHVMDRPSQEEGCYPASRRHWVAMPAKGNISLLVGSWYREVSNDCLMSKAARKDLPHRYARIVQMESQLICDGTLLLKFFLNVSKKEQKARLKELESKKSTRWRVTKDSWEQNERHEEMMRLYDAMMAHTAFEGALWHVLRSEDKRSCKEQMVSIVIDAFTQAIAAHKASPGLMDTPELPHVRPVPTAPMAPLSSFRTFQPVVGDYKANLDQAQKRLRKLQSELYRKQIPMIVGFEGWDAAGKGGSILRLTRALDPRGFEVIPIGVPSPIEKSHHHLWRFWNSIPKDGHIAIFDRTWYGRVLVERVEGLCSEAQWRRAYEEINQFELELARHGTILRKFWLHIDSGEQLTRFEERQNDPEKQWKITREDWRNREKWPEYELAVNDMLKLTHTQHAPWTVVEADNKRFARLKVLHTIIEAMEQRLDQ